jgi:hypothetical protein
MTEKAAAAALISSIMCSHKPVMPHYKDSDKSSAMSKAPLHHTWYMRMSSCFQQHRKQLQIGHCKAAYTSIALNFNSIAPFQCL